MSTVKAYAIRRESGAGSEKSYVLRGVRAALAMRGTSLRAWSHAWARETDRCPSRTYEVAKKTLTRRVSHGLAPKGREGAAVVAALRADLGPTVVPLPSGEAAAS